jgi:DNA helicase II / ATP-dependent DNA helicase PcrA
MKAAEIKVGGLYWANVSGKKVRVRVDAVDQRPGSATGSQKFKAQTYYTATNLSTGRILVFRSAKRFIGPVADAEAACRKVGAAIEQATVGSLSGASPSFTEKVRQFKEHQMNGDQGPSHVVVIARAGTGKTTTLVGGLQVLKGIEPTTVKYTENGPITVPIVPSPQQKAVWDAIAESRGARFVCFAAFNWTIAQELKGRVPPGCDAMTMHSLGYRAINKSIGYCKVDDKNARVPNFICEIVGTDIWDLRKTDPVLLEATTDLVRLCKVNLVGLDRLRAGELDPRDWAEDLDQLASYYDVELNSSRERVYTLVPQVLARCLDVARDKTVDFNDQIWLPVALRLPVFKYDLLLVDEAQDLNRAQQALARMAGKRLVLCGDDRQAIYGFAGADADSIPRMTKELGTTERGVTVLPLTVTRRCGKKIVAEAQKIVPEFEAHEDNPEGEILTARYTEESVNPSGNYWLGGDTTERQTRRLPPEQTYLPMVREGDFVLCRVNAPLVSQCFLFLKMGVKANIQGRDIGKGLKSLIKRLNAKSVKDLITKLDDWGSKEVAKEQAKQFPSESRIIAIQDRVDCLCVFCENEDSVDGVLRRIDNIFTDNKQSPGVRLSSIHKSKGLEARRVFLLRPKGAGCPHPMAKSQWEIQQEHNILYVALTRAIETLVMVS